MAYTPAWYYKQFPGFYNIKSYNILPEYSKNLEKYVMDETCDNSLEENNESNEHVNKKN